MYITNYYLGRLIVSNELFDRLGIQLRVGDTAAYGKSNRNKPIGIGVIQDINTEEVVIQGIGNTKPGRIPRFNAEKRLVLVQPTTSILDHIIQEHFEKHGPPSCEEDLFQCNHYQEDLDVLVAKIMNYLGYFDE